MEAALGARPAALHRGGRAAAGAPPEGVPRLQVQAEEEDQALRVPLEGSLNRGREKREGAEEVAQVEEGAARGRGRRGGRGRARGRRRRRRQREKESQEE